VIAELEARLAEVLGSRLPEPFTGRVEAAPGAGQADEEPTVLVAVRRAEPVEDDLGSRRDEVVPGSDEPRRVVRLRCDLLVEVRPAQNHGRAQQLEGVDALLYELEAPDLRSGAALRVADEDHDPGFLLSRLEVVEALAPPEPGAAGAGPVAVALAADGLFWPVGVPGQAGVAIAEVRLREGTLPLAVELSGALLAGGEPVTVTLRFGSFGTQALRADQPPATLPFGALALALAGAGGRPGAGTLSGGTDGADGVRLAEVTGGTATVTYAPPAEPAGDQLVVTVDDGEGGLGAELARVPLRAARP
jgi:hypothetical protein